MGDQPFDPGEDRLLPGEATSIDSGDADDFRQWVAVYSELYGFKQKLLKELAEQTKHVTPPGGFELQNDKTLLESEASRLHRRLEFWEKRLERRAGA